MLLVLPILGSAQEPLNGSDIWLGDLRSVKIDVDTMAIAKTATFVIQDTRVAVVASTSNEVYTDCECIMRWEQTIRYWEDMRNIIDRHITLPVVQSVICGGRELMLWEIAQIHFVK